MKMLRVLRVAKGLKQEELALRIGKSQPWLSMVEHGKIQPNPSEANRVAEALKCDVRVAFLDMEAFG